MFCFNLFGEERWHLATLQGGKFSLVPTPTKLHPVSHCLSAEHINWWLALKTFLFPSIGTRCYLQKSSAKIREKNFIDGEQRRKMTFCQFANKWKLIHPV